MVDRYVIPSDKRGGNLGVLPLHGALWGNPVCVVGANMQGIPCVAENGSGYIYIKKYLNMLIRFYGVWILFSNRAFAILLCLNNS